jgi:hypothetical protein
MGVSAIDVCKTLIRLHVVGIPAMTLRRLIIEHGHHEWDAQWAMTVCRREGFATIDEHGVWMLAAGADQVAEEIPANYLQAADNYRKARAARPAWWRRMWSRFVDRFDRFAPGLVLLIVTLFFTLGLCAQDVPAWVVRGIAAVETGTEWRAIGDVRGTWSRGSIGEVGPWQLSPAVLRDLKAYERRFRIHADPVLAESLTRAWLLRLYGVTGSWSQAVAAYHAGLGKRSHGFAVEYAARVRAVGGL